MSDQKLKLPLVLNELMVEKNLAHEPITGKVVPDAAIQGAATEMRGARLLGEQLISAFQTITSDPTKSEGERLAQAERACSQLNDTLTRKLDRALAIIDQAESTIDKEYARIAPVDSRDAVLASELRGVLRSLSPEDRSAALERAIANDEATVISSALTVPAMAVGESEELLAARRAHVFQRRHPKEYERKQRLSKTREHVLRAGHSMRSFMNGLFSESKRMLAQAEAARNAAIKAAEISMAEEGK